MCLIAPIGCGGPSAIPQPEFDPDETATAVLALYDADNNDQLDETEIESCPGIKQNLAIYDQDRDGHLTHAEIAARMQELRKYRVGLTRLRCTVTLNGKPLAGAEVQFEPEAFYQGAILAAGGTTGRRGMTQVAIPDEQLPEDQRGIRGVHYGTYRVRITHPEKQLPARYNTETELGYETMIGNPHVPFALKM